MPLRAPPKMNMSPMDHSFQKNLFVETQYIAGYCQLDEEFERKNLREMEKRKKEAEDWRGACGVRRQLSRQSHRSTPGSDPA
jgi:hypothetical protein